MLKLAFFIFLMGGLLLGAWVSRRRERRVLPIWTWALAFALIWTILLVMLGQVAFVIKVSWPVLLLAGLFLFILGFMTCVVAAMTTGGKRHD